MVKPVLFLKRRLRTHHDNGNENVKKHWLNEKNNSCALAARSLIHFFKIHGTNKDVNPFNAWFYRGREHKRRRIFLFLKLGKIEYFRIQRKENSPTFHKLTKAINVRT